MTYTWKFYLLVAHLVDENNHTACNRWLNRVDAPVWDVPDDVKCETCKKFEQKMEGSGSK